MSQPQKKPSLLPVKWSIPLVWTVPDKYSVPFPYSVPTDYSVPDIFEEVSTTSRQTESRSQNTEKKIIDPLTAALITAGMIGLFGGVAVGRISRKKKKEVK